MDFTTFALLLVAAATITACVLAIWWFAPMLMPILGGGAPYVPTRPEIAQRMFKLAAITPTDVCVDLGSGDGRLVIGACERGAKQAIGYELHPGLVRDARRRITDAGFAARATIHLTSMWHADLHDTTVVFVYQVPFNMRRLGKKFARELPKGARIVSHAFELPGWEAKTRLENAILYVKDPSTPCLPAGRLDDSSLGMTASVTIKKQGADTRFFLYARVGPPPRFSTISLATFPGTVS